MKLANKLDNLAESFMDKAEQSYIDLKEVDETAADLLTKYMEGAILATAISTAAIFYPICKTLTWIMKLKN